MPHTDTTLRAYDPRWKRFVTLYPFCAPTPTGQPARAVYLGLAAWLALSAALELAPGTFGGAQAAEPEKLPELSTPKTGPDYHLAANASGLGLERRDAGSRFSAHLESTRRTGSAVGVTGGFVLGETTALGGGLTLGADKRELFANLGWAIAPAQRLILTGGQLRQNLDFDFPSGRAKADLTQNGGGLSYRMTLGGATLDHLELNAYHAATASRDLGAVEYAIDTASLYELWRDPRRVAGGRLDGLQGRAGLRPWQGGSLDLGLGRERLRYDQLGGIDSHARGTARAEIGQAVATNARLKFGVDAGAAQTRYSLGVELAVDGTRLGVAIDSSRGRDGMPNDRRLQFSWTLAHGTRPRRRRLPRRPPRRPNQGPRPQHRR